MKNKHAFCPSIEVSEPKQLMSGWIPSTVMLASQASLPPQPIKLAEIDVTKPVFLGRTGGLITLSETTIGLGKVSEIGVLKIHAVLADTHTGKVFQDFSSLYQVNGYGGCNTKFQVNFGHLPAGDYTARISVSDGSGQNPSSSATYIDFDIVYPAPSGPPTI